MLEVEEKYLGIEEIIEEHRRKPEKKRRESRQVHFRVAKFRKRLQKTYLHK